MPFYFGGVLVSQSQIVNIIVSVCVYSEVYKLRQFCQRRTACGTVQYVLFSIPTILSLSPTSNSDRYLEPRNHFSSSSL